MFDDYLYYTIAFIVITIVSFYFSFKGSSNNLTYVSRYNLINGIMFGVLAFFLILTDFNLDRTINKSIFHIFIIFWTMFTLFISGLYGVINKDKINNLILDSVSRQSLWGSVIMFFGLIFFLIRWHYVYGNFNVLGH